MCEYLMGTSPFAMRNDLVGQPPSSQIEVYWGMEVNGHGHDCGTC